MGLEFSGLYSWGDRGNPKRAERRMRVHRKLTRFGVKQKSCGIGLGVFLGCWGMDFN